MQINFDTCTWLHFDRKNLVSRKRPTISSPIPVDPVSLRGHKWRHVIVKMPPVDKSPTPPPRKKRKLSKSSEQELYPSYRSKIDENSSADSVAITCTNRALVRCVEINANTNGEPFSKIDNRKRTMACVLRNLQKAILLVIRLDLVKWSFENNIRGCNRRQRRCSDSQIHSSLVRIIK